MARRVWADLPPELIPSISDHLGLINLLSFRGVCKSWNSASITSSAEIESSPYCQPWYLLYGETCQCLLLSGHGKKYNINIPELSGATCIASKEGWLLFYQEGSMYFFCPFSRAKIDLPQFPSPKIKDLVAAFSSAPTSNDCIVTVGCQNNEMEIELYVLSRGDDAWTKQEYTQGKINKITAAAYADKTFQFFDDLDGLLAFSPGEEEEEEKWVKYNIIPPSKEKKPGIKSLPFALERSSLKRKGLIKSLGLKEEVSITSCGTVVPNGEGHILYFNESISESQESGSQFYKGVWFTPRFYQIPPEFRW